MSMPTSVNLARALPATAWLLLGAFALALAGVVALPVASLERSLVARGGGIFFALVALPVALRMPKPARSIWLPFWLYLAATVIGDVVATCQEATLGEVPYPGLADAFYLSCYGFAFAGLRRLTRHLDPRRSLEMLLDTLIVGLALFAIVYYSVLAPQIEHAKSFDPAFVLTIAYTSLDILVLAALVRSSVLVVPHNVALLALSAALLLFMPLDLAYSYYNSVGMTFEYQVPWLIALMLIALAITLPSAAAILPLNNSDTVNVTSWRAAIIALSVLVAPALAVIDQGWGEGRQTLVIVTSGMIVVVLLLVRTYRLLHEFQAQQAILAISVRESSDARKEAFAAQQKAEAASVAKSQFLSVMSHELRTPLTSIVGFLEMIENSSTDEKLRDFAARGLGSCEHLLKLIEEILDLSSVEAGRLTVVQAPFSMGRLLDDVVQASLGRQKPAVGFSVHAEEGLRSLELSGDALRLKQILINLLGNAIKFTNQGSVVLSVRSVGGTPDTPLFEFAIEDTGIGLSPEQIDHLFQVFAQVDMGNSRRFGGTGLGLAISQRLVTLLGGKPIVVTSQQGAGSRFSFRLAMPLAGAVSGQDAMSGNSVSVVPRERLAGLRVLVVDDIETIRFMLRHHLETEGAIVDEAADGAEGVSMAISTTVPHDLILMDMQMSVMDGIDATRELRERGYTRPIVGLTGSAFESDMKACLAAGMNDFVTKPVKINDLVIVLQRNRTAEKSSLSSLLVSRKTGLSG